MIDTLWGLISEQLSGYDPVRDAASQAFNAILDGADVSRTLAELDVKANKVHKESSP